MTRSSALRPMTDWPRALLLLLTLSLPLLVGACRVQVGGNDSGDASGDEGGVSVKIGGNGADDGESGSDGEGEDGDDADDEAEPKPTVARTIASVVTADGSLRVPVDPQTVGFPASGRVIDVLVSVGDIVFEDDVLAQIDPISLDLSIASAEAELASALGGVARSQSGGTIETARLELERSKNSLWQQQINRDATCGRSGPFASEGDCDAAQAGVQVAEQGVRIAELNHGAAVSAAPGELAANRAQLRRAQASLAMARSERSRAVLTAPFDGEITVVHTAIGVQASPGAPAITLAATGPLRFITTTLGERNIGDIVEDVDATVTLNAFPDHPLDATVVRIATSGTTDASGIVVYDVSLEVEPDGLALRAGMTGRVEIEVGDE